MKFYTFFIGIMLLVMNSKAQTDTLFLESLMRQNPTQFEAILNHSNEYRLQIIYTQINRDKNNIPSFKEYSYHLNPRNYFYPASTVKMPLALLALEKINDLKIKGLTKSTTLIYDSSKARQETIYHNPYAIDGRQTIEQAIKEVFIVSDNNAANRLFELVTPKTIHQKLATKGYKDVYIRNRLELGRTPEENRNTQGIQFFDEQGNRIHQQEPQYNNDSLPYYNEFIGKAYYNNRDELIQAPLNFSEKNRIYLSDLHHILQSIIFHDQTPKKQQFNISKEDQSFLLKSMQTLPTQSTYPTYDTASYYPAYTKFLMFGSEKGTIPSHLKIFSKAGDAYGFLLDIAYIMDSVSKVEFMLSAVIYVNSDGILNDNKYDYNTIGLPFMKNLGNSVYQYELNRTKKYLPNFTTLLSAIQ